MVLAAGLVEGWAGWRNRGCACGLIDISVEFRGLPFLYSGEQVILATRSPVLDGGKRSPKMGSVGVCWRLGVDWI